MFNFRSKSLLDFKIKTSHQRVFAFPYLDQFWIVGLWLCRYYGDFVYISCVRAPLQRSRGARQRTTKRQQWRIFCGTCTVPWPLMPFGSTLVRSSCRMPRWPSSAALWIASSNWPSIPTRMETVSETSEWPVWYRLTLSFNLEWKSAVLIFSALHTGGIKIG